jgi:hypothetical protein
MKNPILSIKLTIFHTNISTPEKSTVLISTPAMSALLKLDFVSFAALNSMLLLTTRTKSASSQRHPRSAVQVTVGNITDLEF